MFELFVFHCRFGHEFLIILGLLSCAYLLVLLFSFSKIFMASALNIYITALVLISIFQHFPLERDNEMPSHRKHAHAPILLLAICLLGIILLECFGVLNIGNSLGVKYAAS